MTSCRRPSATQSRRSLRLRPHLNHPQRPHRRRKARSKAASSEIRPFESRGLAECADVPTGPRGLDGHRDPRHRRVRSRPLTGTRVHRAEPPGAGTAGGVCRLERSRRCVARLVHRRSSDLRSQRRRRAARRDPSRVENQRSTLLLLHRRERRSSTDLPAPQTERRAGRTDAAPFWRFGRRATSGPAPSSLAQKRFGDGGHGFVLVANPGQYSQ
jgi:hypothetical protein